MVDIDDYKEEKSCVYNGETYLVRDNGAVMRKARPNQRKRKLDGEWTFGKLNKNTGYLEISSVRIHRIVATAFHGEPPTQAHIVDHIDTNRQNNRPSNLRWLTRLENVVLNDLTRKRIEYRIGGSIYDFLRDPAKYRAAFDDPDFSWMRRVTKEEAEACLQNIKRWAASAPKAANSGAKLGEWIYQPRTGDSPQAENASAARVFHPNIFGRTSIVIDSLTPLAKQKDWRTPTNFVCCPKQIEENPILSYTERLSEDAVFATNQYGESRVVKYTLLDDQAILLIAGGATSVKPYGLVKITYEDGYYLHTSLGTFFTADGADKRFTLAQGLEWTGGDSIDDYL